MYGEEDVSRRGRSRTSRVVYGACCMTVWTYMFICLLVMSIGHPITLVYYYHHSVAYIMATTPNSSHPLTPVTSSPSNALTTSRAQAPRPVAVTQTPQGRRLPQVLIIGCHRCGTSALLHYMSFHPSITAAKHEVHYFDNSSRFAEGDTWYRGQMPLTDKPGITLEKTSSYFSAQKAPQRIKLFNPRIKLLFLAKDPTKRLLSELSITLQANRNKTYDYRHDIESLVLHNTSTGKVDNSSSLIQRGLYHVNMRLWLQYFSKSQLMVVDSDNLRRDPAAQLQKIEKFLHIPTYFQREHFVFDIGRGGLPCPAKGKGRKECPKWNKGIKLELSKSNPNLVAKIQEYYRPYNKQFFDLVGHWFPWS